MISETEYRVSAPSATRDMWVGLEWKGRPRLGPWLLEDGRSILHVVADGDVGEVPFPVWMQRFNNGKRLGDLLWTTGPIKIASVRFVAVLEEIQASGWRAFEIPILDKANGNLIKGYLGFATTGDADGLDVSHLYHDQNFSFRVKAHVLDALLEAGVNRFESEPAAPR